MGPDMFQMILPRPKREAMTQKILNSLKAGTTYPSSSPARAGFFFVGKREGFPCPCIDYGGLTDGS